MTDLHDKTVVVTGAASGIGLALAECALSAGSKVMLSDLSADALAREGTRLSQRFGNNVATHAANVAIADDMHRLAEHTLARFGSADILVNNAGIFAAANCWEMPIDTYDKLIDVNVKGVLHGIRAFVPIMLAQQTPCHVVNIASAAGITASPGLGGYCLTKHAVIAVSEALHLDLRTQGHTQIGVTIAMPGLIRTNIMNAATRAPEIENAQIDAIHRSMSKGVETGMPAAEAAALIFGAVADNKLYVAPNFSGPREQAFATAIALGRISGDDPYRDLIEAHLRKTPS